MGYAKDAFEDATDEQFLEDAHAIPLWPTFFDTRWGRQYRIYVVSETPAYRMRQNQRISPEFLLELLKEHRTQTGGPMFHLQRSRSDPRFYHVAYTPEALAERRLERSVWPDPTGWKRTRAKLRRAGLA